MYTPDMLGLLLAASLAMPSTPPTLDPTYGFKLPKPGKEKKLPKDADWIWAKDVKDNQTVWLRRRFLTSTTTSKAALYVAVDDEFEAFLDGKSIGKTSSAGNGDSSWQNVQKLDVSGELTSGEHTLTIRAVNKGGDAGVIARLEVGGKVKLFSDKEWEATEDVSGQSGFVPATVECKNGEGPWGDKLNGWPVPVSSVPGYLFHLPIKPVAYAEVTADTDPDNVPWQPTKGKTTFSIPTGKSLLFDFGKELSGRVLLSSDKPQQLTVGGGESTGEAIQKPYTTATFQLDHSEKGSPYSAMRYAKVSGDGAEFKVTFDHLYYPVEYKGAFDCSDPLLTKIWYTGAYTAHLCMQQDIWDAPKRDRARWMGDLHVSGEVINDVFLDKFLMEQTMKRLRDDAQRGHAPTELPNSHVNGIPGYSCAWLAGLADFYRHTGDKAYVQSQKDGIVSMLEYFRGEFNSDNLFVNTRKQWPFVDWSDDFNTDNPRTWQSTHFFMVKAINEGAYLLGELGDSADQVKYAAWSKQLATAGEASYKDANGVYSDRRQENAMAIFSGSTTPADNAAIYNQVLKPGNASWSKVVSPYYNNYVIYALGMSGHTQDAIDFIRSFWGGMLDEGATTIWEGYDPSWDKHNFHSHLQADNGTGYFVSLCHGWSAGPTSFLTDCVLGVKATGGGFSTATIEPHLGNLKWATGTVPTPKGDIKLSLRKEGDKTSGIIDLPKGVSCTLTLEGAQPIQLHVGRNAI